MEKFSAIIGLGIASILIFISMGNVSLFIDMPSVMIVFGGTLGATLIVAGVSGLIQAAKTTALALTKTDSDRVQELARVYKLAQKARKSNILSLEEDCLAIEDEFLKKGLQLVIDGVSPEMVEGILTKEIENTYQRHIKGQEVLSYIAEAAPSMGMVGTLIGLIGMLANMDPNTIGANMSKALLTTFYGALIANIVFIPLSRKLESKTAEEIQLKKAILEGLLSIQASEAPSTTEVKLVAYIPPSLREVFEELIDKKS